MHFWKLTHCCFWIYLDYTAHIFGLEARRALLLFSSTWTFTDERWKCGLCRCCIQKACKCANPRSWPLFMLRVYVTLSSGIESHWADICTSQSRNYACVLSIWDYVFYNLCWESQLSLVVLICLFLFQQTIVQCNSHYTGWCQYSLIVLCQVVRGTRATRKMFR